MEPPSLSLHELVTHTRRTAASSGGRGPRPLASSVSYEDEPEDEAEEPEEEASAEHSEEDIEFRKGCEEEGVSAHFKIES